MGAGPMTGRAAGYCAGYQLPGFMNPHGGRYTMGFGAGRGGFPYGGGRGRAWGGGRGWSWRAAIPGYAPFYFGAPTAYEPFPYQPPSPEQEIEYMKNQAAAIEKELKAIRNRIEELKKSQEKKES